MLTTHLTFLRKAVRASVNARSADVILSILEKMRTPKTAIYRLIKDIVADARFYSVTEWCDDFWKKYGVNAIADFIETIPSQIWKDENKLTELKEDFLNEWMANNILPLTSEEKIERMSLYYLNADLDYVPGNASGLLNRHFNDSKFEDKTSSSKIDLESLPYQMKPFLQPQKENGKGEGDRHTSEVNYLNRLDPELVRLAEMIGRSGGASVSKGKYSHANKSDINGITSGNDLNSVIPSELALLGSPRTENIFLKKFTSKQLQIFSSASSSSEKTNDTSGPIYICVDTSGSMTGAPEETAKTLALAISIIAQRKHRPVILINYSDKVSFFVLTNLSEQKFALLSFLSSSYGGGNDENLLFDFIFNGLPNNSKYKKIENLFSGADLLMISDFEWGSLTDDALNLLENARKEGMKIFSLGMDYESKIYKERNFDCSNLNEEGFFDSPSLKEEYRKWHYYNGHHFFQNSDYKFTYIDGVIQEL
ncbi:MAG: hypothetical protein HDS03_03235 [Bacteroides sp.]|nr:hypothetical protein [Bacteroides sp.]